MRVKTEFFRNFICPLAIVFFSSGAGAAGWQWGQPGAKGYTPLQGERRAIIMTPQPGDIIRKDAAIFADIAGIKSYDDVKNLEYYVDDKRVREEGAVPFSDGLFLPRDFDDGVHLLSVRFVLRDGQVAGYTIPVISAKAADAGKVALWQKDATAILADKNYGQNLFALINEIVELKEKIGPAKLEYEALCALVGKPSSAPSLGSSSRAFWRWLKTTLHASGGDCAGGAISIPASSVPDISAFRQSCDASRRRSQPEDNAQVRQLKAYSDYLNKILGEYTASVEQINKADQKKIKAALELKRAEYKGKRSCDYLPELGYNGRYFLANGVRGAQDIRDNYAKLGVNFFFPYPAATAITDASLDYAKDHNGFAVGSISYAPWPDDPDFPRKRPKNNSGEFTWKDYRLLSWKYPRNFMVSISEFGLSRVILSVAHAKNKPTTRLEAEENFVSALKEYLDYWTPPEAGVFAWDNFGPPAPQYAGGVDVFLTQLYRGQNIEIACASLRGNAKAYQRYFGVSVTPFSWLAAALDWGLKTENKDTVGALTSQSVMWRYLKTAYAEEDINRLYYYSYFSGATVVGHEEAFQSEGIRKYTDFLKKHTRIGLPEARVAVLTGLGDSHDISVDGDDARYYAEELMWHTDPYGMAENSVDSDWGDHSHFNDYALLNIFYPDFGNAHYTWRQYTGTPLGQIDLVSALAPFKNDAYKVLLMISVNALTPELADKLGGYVRDGGILIINIEQCRDARGVFSAHCEKFLAEVAGVSAGAMQIEKNGVAKFMDPEIYGFPTNKNYPAKHLKIRDVKVKSGKVIAALDDGAPVCVKNNFGKGTVFLTTSQWHWRLPFDFMRDLTEKIALKQDMPARIIPANPYVETFLCKFADGQGASLAVFNHQAHHTKTQHFRKIFKQQEMILPGTSDHIYAVDLTNKTEQSISFSFATPIDFKKYDEIVLRCKADGDQPGGGIWLTFYDDSGKKAWWPLGQVSIGKIVGERWFERFISPQYPNVSNVGDAKTDAGFDWRKVNKLDITLKRGKDNPPLSYRFHLKNMALLNLLTSQKVDAQRECIPYKGTVEINPALIGLHPDKIKVYAADPDLNLSPAPFAINGGKISFDVNVAGDWKEYFVKEEK